MNLSPAPVIAMFVVAASAAAEADLRFVDPAPEAGFHHGYFVLVPEHVRDDAPFFMAVPTPKPADNEEVFVDAARGLALSISYVPEELGLPMLVPVVPRPMSADPEQGNLYLPALTHQALLAEDTRYARIDLQVLAMAAHARAVLDAEGTETSGRFVLHGFSAGGDFVTRFAAIHPARVEAVWAGGTGGLPILPVAAHEGRELTYPLGIADFERLTGVPFDVDAFAMIPMMIVQGGADDNDSVPFRDSYSAEQERVVREVFPGETWDRVPGVREIYRSVGSAAEFRVYDGVGHELTNKIIDDMFVFYESALGAD